MKTLKELRAVGAVGCVIGMIVMSGCTPAKVERAPEPEPTPTPPPPVTPHPAAAAQERAVQLYPDLAVKDSLFNRTFLELVEQTRQTNPRELTMVDWPIVIAHQTGRMLGKNAVQDGPKATPPPPPPATPETVYVPVTPKIGSSLDKGAYGQSQLRYRSAP